MKPVIHWTLVRDKHGIVYKCADFEYRGKKFFIANQKGTRTFSVKVNQEDPVIVHEKDLDKCLMNRL